MAFSAVKVTRCDVEAGTGGNITNIKIPEGDIGTLQSSSKILQEHSMEPP